MSYKISTLNQGDRIPPGTPTRYRNSRGYIRLRWLVAPATYVEIYEHRLVAGRPDAGMEVHHLNGTKTDNRPENLVVLSKAEHAKLHFETRPLEQYRVPRQPLDTYPKCTRESCERPAQCTNRTLCLKHYKAAKRAKSRATVEK